MKYLLRHLLLVTGILLICVSCKHDDGDAPGPQSPEVSRTVLVYMAANNSPSLPYKLNFDAMVSAVDAGALDNGGRLIVFSKTSSAAGPVLIELTKDSQTTLKTYPAGSNTVDPEMMKTVIADTREIAPAQEYGLLLWSHASGWRSPNRSWGQDVGFTGPEREMSIPDLADALGHKQFRFIYMDCCFMGNIETLYELRNAADFIIASSTETPYAGMDYGRNIPAFFSKQLDLGSLAVNTYDAIANLTRDGDYCGIAISLYDMSRIGAVADAVKAIYSSAQTTYVDPSRIQQYGFSGWSGYFYDLSHYMHTLTADASLVARFDNALAQFVPVFRHTDVLWLNYGNYPLDNVNGVSAFIPGSSNLQTRYHYDDLQWYHDVVAPYMISHKTE
ncbi:clostripain-related cysteine peptidase [uncultured Muribaculum sp.]|uniref:clostripain-related cysteine peptidase n=1 Tax=uncultured Muribaculum sp. TaxID=1918613 RepID=UPI0025FF151C|nr:clostripain-related cysteine peptidase [uncultured Muribaculum sp.]